VRLNSWIAAVQPNETADIIIKDSNHKLLINKIIDYSDDKNHLPKINVHIGALNLKDFKNPPNIRFPIYYKGYWWHNDK